MISCALSTTKSIRLSKVLMDISQRLRGTSLDVLPGPDNVHYIYARGASMDNTLMLPVSRER